MKTDVGPWWLFGVFDANWKIVDVVAWTDSGEELVDAGFTKTLRLRDVAITDWTAVKLELKRLRQAFRGTTKPARLDRGGASVRRFLVPQVDRLPPRAR